MPGWPAGYPSKGIWRFQNVDGGFDYWPMLDTISISQGYPDGISSLAVRVEDRDASLTFADGEEHRVFFRGVRIWAGHIRVTDRDAMSEAGPRVWDLTGQDFTAKLDDSVILTETERPRESVADRVAWILSHLNFAITTDNVNLPAGTVEPAVYEGDTVRQALEQVASEKGLHDYVDFDKDLHMFRTETIAAPFSLSNVDPDYIASFPHQAFRYKEDEIDLTNAVRVKGLRLRRWRTDPDSILAHERQESAIIDDSLITLAQVEAAGDRRLYQLADPIVEGSLECWEPGLRAGQTLDIEDALWPDKAGEFIVTSVEISAVQPGDADGESNLHTAITFSDKRRVGRFPGGGKDIADANTPPGGGGGGTGEDPIGSCCNPIDTSPNDLIAWSETSLPLDFKQGYTSGISHAFLFPDGSGYPGGVSTGENRQLLLFLMTGDELPGSGGGLDALGSPWSLIAAQVIACTHGFAPFNAGHPNMQTRVYRLDIDGNPGELPDVGASVVLASDDAIEVLWASVLIQGTSGAVTVGPNGTDWNAPDWTTSLPSVGVGNRALYFQLAFNRYWNNSEHGLGLSAGDHNTSIVTGIPTGFDRLVAAVGGDKTMFVDTTVSPVDTGAGVPTLSVTGYSGTGGSQDFIITRILGVGIEPGETGLGVILPGPTWEGGNRFEPVAEEDMWEVVDGNLVITSDTPDLFFTYRVSGPPDLPTAIDDWAITQPFELDVAGSLTDDGSRFVQVQLYRDGIVRYFMLYLGDSANAQGVSVYAPPDEVFVEADITETVKGYFKYGLSDGVAVVKMWMEGDPEPDWMVSTDIGQEATSDFEFLSYSVSLGNDGGTPQTLILYPPTIEGMALSGEAVDWEVVGYGDNATTTFETRYPYDELSLHVRVDGQVLGGTAIDSMDGAAGTFTLVSAPYGDPSDPTGSSVVEAKYTRT